MIKLLLEHGADVNIHDRQECNHVLYLGKTPLHYAVCSANVETVKTMIAYGADVNAISQWRERDSTPRTPLLLAQVLAEKDERYHEIVEILRANGAKP